MIRTFALGTLLAASAATPLLAQSPRDGAATVHSLEVQSRLSPTDGGTAIELAAAYQRAGRPADADTTLRRALVLDNAMLETPTGDAVWSHTVAKRALARDVALTSR